MSRAYIRVSPDFYERKVLAQKYPPGAALALIGCLCLAETQPTRGHFRDRKVLAVLLDSQAKWIPFLVDHGDLIEQASYPRLYVDGWQEWQEGDVTVPERMARLRARKRGDTPEVTPPVTVADTVPVTPPVTTARIAEAVSGALDNGGGGDGAPYNGSPQPTTFMGFRPRPEPERLPGEAIVPIHDGSHGPECDVCFPLTRVGSIEEQHAASMADAARKTAERARVGE
jgi:hypothetical protein